MEQKIVEIIQKVTDNPNLTIDNNIDLIEEDVIDSFAFIELITELEDTFNIEIQPSQIPSQTWRNIESIIQMVKEKMEG